MRRFTLALTLLLAATSALADTHDWETNGDDCTTSHFRWNDRKSYVAKESIDGRGLRSIKASVSNSPISVVGDSNGGYSIEVCKAAAIESDLAAIHVSLDGDELRATGPDSSRWTVMYKIHVPRNADVQVEAKNGPLSLRDVDGKVVARSTNGPLSLSNVSGNIDATTTNGPISVRGGSGNMKVAASNGPLSIALDGNSWEGGSLDASTKNGPLSVKVPRNYNSGVVIEASGRSPFACHAEGCAQWRRTNDDDDDDYRERSRRVELGSGRTDVRISTVNGPVTIKDGK